jgi:hypothetical protein
MAQDDREGLDLVRMLLGEVSAALGGPLGLDEAGQCVLGFEGNVEVLLAVDDEGALLSLSSELGVARNEAACQAALTMNYGGLPPRLSIALEPASGQLALFCLLAVAGVTTEELLELLAEFVTLRAAIRERLSVAVAESGSALGLGTGIRG